MSIRAVQCEKKTKHDMHSWEKDRQEVFCLGVEVPPRYTYTWGRTRYA